MQNCGRDRGPGHRRQPLFLVIAAAAAALVPVTPATSATDAGDPITLFLNGTTVQGEIEAGGEPTSVEGPAGKFEEYRDIPDNAVINDVRLRGENEEHDYFAEFRAEDVVQEDQRYQLRMGKYGRYEFEVQWDQIPHVLSTTGRSLFAETRDGEFLMADAIRQILATDPSQLPQVLNAAHDVSLATRQDTGRFRIRYTPLPEWDVRLGYAVQRDRGHRPLDTASFTSLNGGGPNPFLASIVEFPSPIDFLTHTVDSSIEYHGRDWFLRVAETSSFFEDQFAAMAWDNPFQLTDEFGAGSQGRLALTPNNQAHTVSLSAGGALPMRTRLTGTFAYGWMLQDDDFVPATINAALPVAAVPRRSYDGALGTLLANVLLSTRPLDAVTLNGRYHLYDLDNRSPTLTFTNYAVDDAVLGGLRRSVPYAYSRQSAGADVVVRPLPLGSLKIAYEWALWHREHREVRNSEEYRVGPSVDLTPARGLLLRAGYTHANRDPKDYDPYAASETGSLALFNPLLRKFDEAYLDRDQVATLASVTAVPRVSFTGTFTYAADDFTRSTFGLLDDDNLTYSFELAGAPHERVTLYGSYTSEDHRFNQRSGFGPLGKADFLGRGHDTVDTWGAGGRAELLPGTMDVDLNYSLSLGVARLRASSASEDVADFPNVDTRLHQFTAMCNYKLTKQLTARFGYAFERYETNDFASQVMQPYMTSSDGPKDPLQSPSIFLGARDPDGDYNAHVGTVALRYQF